MNTQLPTKEYGAHFWADSSRELIDIIEFIINMYAKLKNTEYAFEVNEYYFNTIKKCRDFLSMSGGSQIPPYMKKIELYYGEPIFQLSNNITVKTPYYEITCELKLIGKGSYAEVYEYKDLFYNRTFAIKRAKKDLSDKELVRFKREFEEMEKLSSPYILNVYKYRADKNEYIMEYVKHTLESYISKNNSKLSVTQRLNIAQQVLRAFNYIHSKGRLHRDISPNNILVKEYDDVSVIKISDFGLVKIPESKLTTINTEFKGYFNDPDLITEGFNNYNILHETYALTRIIYYIMTGRTNTDKISNEKLYSFVRKGLNANKTIRFQNVEEMIKEFRLL